MKRIQIINGPNLNLLGKREPGIYGSQSFEEWLNETKGKFPGIEIAYFQSNVEGEIINKIHECGFTADGIIINAGGYTHTSIAIADAIRGVPAPTIEVHISNVYAREEYRKTSYIAAAAKGLLTGFGLKGYELALYWFN